MNRRRVPPLSGLAVALGLLTAGWPLIWAPAWCFAPAGLAVAAVVAGAVLRWRPGPSLAVAAAIVSCAFSAAGVAALAAEGLLILGYLLAADAPAGLVAPGRWLRRQVPLLVAGLITAGTALAAFAIRPPASAWLVLTGLAAAVTAYLGALPAWRRGRLRSPSARLATGHGEVSSFDNCLLPARMLPLKGARSGPLLAAGGDGQSLGVRIAAGPGGGPHQAGRGRRAAVTAARPLRRGQRPDTLTAAAALAHPGRGQGHRPVRQDTQAAWPRAAICWPYGSRQSRVIPFDR